MADPAILDGSYGEGGGQILRTALSLSMITGRGFRITNIRATRRRPGLLPQHLAAVRAAETITGATVSGDTLGSAELDFTPAELPRSGAYLFDVAETAEQGSAGSVTLILQTVLIPLAFADGASTIVLRGGTHVAWSPPFDSLVGAYLPILKRLGFRIDGELKRWGWYPLGGGEIECAVAARRRRGLARVDHGACAWPAAPHRRASGRRESSRSHPPTHGGSGTGVACRSRCFR